MADFHIVVEGDEEAQRRIHRLTLFLLDLRGFCPLVVSLFVQWMRRQFESEGAFGGEPWAPLSTLYAAGRR